MKPAQNMLFDLDGTLINSIDLIATSFRHTLGTHLPELPPQEQWMNSLGQPLWDQFGLFTDDKQLIDRMIATYRTHNMKHHDHLLREYDGIREVVLQMKASGVRLGVVTSKLHDMALRGLSRCGYTGAFELVIGADDVERHKPHPEPVLKALEVMGIEATTTFYVGDSPHDMLSGRAAGTMTAAVLWGPFAREALEPAAPDRWIERPGELLELV